MNIIIIILLVLAGIIALLLLIAAVSRKRHFVRREIIIHTPRQKVFDYLKLLKNQDAFNKYASASPGREKKFTGTDGTEGFIYSWKGDKSAGEGEKEIMSIIDGKKVETQIRFIKPMRTIANIVMETESLSQNETRVIWSNAGTLIYPLNIMIPMMEKHVAKDMDDSLVTLKDILESDHN